MHKVPLQWKGLTPVEEYSSFFLFFSDEAQRILIFQTIILRGLVCHWTRRTVICCFSRLLAGLAPYLALAQGALGAMFNPGGATEAWDVVLVRARLGDVVADGVGLAGVGDTAGTALALGHHGKLAVHRRAWQRPAVHLPLLQRQRETILRKRRKRESSK